MVPYVRKSFYKHFKDGIKYLGLVPKSGVWAEPSEEDKTNFQNKNYDKISIESQLYKNELKVYNYAIDMTKKEIHQAVEGLYHNLK